MSATTPDMATEAAIRPFEVSVPDEQLKDLRGRITAMPSMALAVMRPQTAS